MTSVNPNKQNIVINSTNRPDKQKKKGCCWYSYFYQWIRYGHLQDKGSDFMGNNLRKELFLLLNWSLDLCFIFLFESNGREVRWDRLGWLQTLVALPAQTGTSLRNQDQTWPGKDEEDPPRILQVAVTLFRDELTGFLRPENFNECLYAFSTGTDQVSLTVEVPSIDKYKKKSTHPSTQATSSSE